MNADGSGARQLTSGDSFDYDPAFSPDGREVVFDRKVGSSNSPHIYSVELNSSTVQQLTRGSAHDTEPVFAPDGSRIVFVSNRDVDGRRDHSDIFEMAPDGTRIRILIDGRRDEYEPDVAPNSRRIVFMSNRDGGPDIYTAHKDGHGVRRVTSDRPNCFDSSCWSSPVYSPDGSHIAALRSSRYSTSLEVMRVDGGGVKEFASGSTEEEGYGTVIGPPSWGPAPK